MDAKDTDSFAQANPDPTPFFSMRYAALKRKHALVKSFCQILVDSSPTLEELSTDRQGIPFFGEKRATLSVGCLLSTHLLLAAFSLCRPVADPSFTPVTSSPLG